MPSVLDFQQAVQYFTEVCFASDAELREATPVNNPKKKHKIISRAGKFAVFFPMNCGSRQVGVRFLHATISSVDQRYGIISAGLKKLNVPHFMDFEYRCAEPGEGATVEGQLEPYMKMEYIEGPNLKRHVEGLLENGATAEIRGLADQWNAIVQDMEQVGIAHGDIHSENILVDTSGRLRLIDLDGMFVPDMAKMVMNSPLIGAAGFQHPGRSQALFDATMDRFSALVLYLTLIALAEDPGLYDPQIGESAILFSGEDWQQPRTRPIFKRLLGSGDSEVRSVAQVLIDAALGPIGNVPAFSSICNPSQPLIEKLRAAVESDRFDGILDTARAVRDAGATLPSDLAAAVQRAEQACSAHDEVLSYARKGDLDLAATKFRTLARSGEFVEELRELRVQLDRARAEAASARATAAKREWDKEAAVLIDRATRAQGVQNDPLFCRLWDSIKDLPAAAALAPYAREATKRCGQYQRALAAAESGDDDLLIELWPEIRDLHYAQHLQGQYSTAVMRQSRAPGDETPGDE